MVGRLVWTPVMDEHLLAFLKGCHSDPEYCGENGFKSKAYKRCSSQMADVSIAVSKEQIKSRWQRVRPTLSTIMYLCAHYS